MAQIAKKTKRYPSDLTDEEWDRLAPLMPKPGRRGRPREVDFREVIAGHWHSAGTGHLRRHGFIIVDRPDACWGACCHRIHQWGKKCGSAGGAHPERGG